MSEGEDGVRGGRHLLASLRRRQGSGPSRLVGLDVARFVALIGMMTAHILPRTVDGPISWQQRIVTGNSAALFAVLAGVTMALLSGRTLPSRDAALTRVTVGLAVRAALIMAIGLALNRLEDRGIGVILPYYGVLFLLALPFLRLRARSLAWWAAGWALVAPVASFAARGALAPLAPGGFSAQSPGGVVQALLLSGDYPAFPWVAYVLCGLAVGRLDLAKTRVAAGLVGAGTLLATGSVVVSGWLTSSAVTREVLVATSGGLDAQSWQDLLHRLAVGTGGVTPTGSWWWLAVDAPHSGTTADLLRGCGIAMAVIGAAVWVVRRDSAWWRIPFGAGSMTLTLYSLHLVMLKPAIWPDLGAPRWLSEVAVVVIVGAVFAGLGLKGPLEALVTGMSRSTADRVLTGARRLQPSEATNGAGIDAAQAEPALPLMPRMVSLPPDGTPLAEASTPGVGARVRRGAMWAGIGAVTFRLAGFIPSVVIARILSPEDFGVFAVALTAYLVVASMGELGFGAYVSRHTEDVLDVAPTAATMSVVAGSALGALMFLFAKPLATLLGSAQAAGSVRILSLLLVMVGLFAVPSATLTREFRQKQVFYADVAAFLPGNVSTIGLATQGFGAAAFAWGRVVGTFVVGCIRWRMAPQRFGFNRRYVPRLLRFGLPVTGANLFNLMLLNADFVIIGRELGATELGVYSLAFNLAGWATALLSGMVTVAVPAIGHAGTDPIARSAAVRRMLESFSVLAFAVCAAVSALAGPLIRTVYGLKWEAALPVLTVLPVFGALNVLALLLGNILIGLGKPRVLFAVQASWLLLLVPLLLVGVSVDGIRGASIAHVGTLLVVLPLFAWRLKRDVGIDAGIFVAALWRPTLAAVLAWGAARAVVATGLHDLLTLLLGGVAGAVVYSVLTWPLLTPHVARIVGRLPGPMRRRVPMSVAAREEQPAPTADESPVG